MGLRINSNIAALSSYNNLNKTDKAVSSSLEKLSSGYRINKAADDAAGLVVSEGLKSQIGGLTVAARNAQDGVNVAQTADGALSTVTDILQRMRDLSVQASNSGTQDSTALAAANTEFQQLKTEIDRIASTTAFGGQKLLDGTYGTGVTQLNGYVKLDADADTVTTGNQAGIAQAAAKSYNLTVSLKDGAGVLQSVALADVAIANPASGGGYTSAAAYQKALQDGIDSAISGSGSLGASYVGRVKASVTDTADGYWKITLTNSDGGVVTTATSTTTASDAVAKVTGNGATVAASSGPGGVFQIGSNNTTNDRIVVGISGTSSSLLSLSGTDLSSSANAQTAITAVDAAIAKVSSSRASLGAIQNRFEKTIDNLNTAIQNITASNSAIRDTDMAAEMTKFTKNQVLAQAGTSMLAQANSSTQNILTLLRG